MRGLLFYFGPALGYPELKYFALAKAFSGGKWLYKDVWEIAEPISSFIYFILPSKFEYFVNTAFWLNSFLLAFNAFYINSILQKYDIMSEKSYLPSFFYLLISLSSLQLSTFSPPLLASFFLLFVIQKTLSYLKKEDVNEMYDAGFFLGLASFCYMPSLMLSVSLFLTLLFFTRSNGKAYLLFALGIVFPWLLLSVVYLWKGGLWEMYVILLGKYFGIRYDYISWTNVAYSLMFPAGLFILGVFYSLTGRTREINYQSICRRFFLVWLLGGVLCFFVSPTKSTSDFHLLFPSVVFYFSYYFLQIKKVSIPNTMLLLSIPAMVLWQYYGYKWLKKDPSKYRMVDYRAATDPLIRGKKVWVLGTHYTYYIEGVPATKYLNWQVSQDDFGKLDAFSSLENIRENLQLDKPEVIIDEQKLLPELFKRVPFLAREYVLAAPNVYIIGNSNK